MADIESLLNRWQSAGALDAETAARIRAFEAESVAAGREEGDQYRQPALAGIKWQGLTALILGAILLACGVALFVSAHWDELDPFARFALVVAVVAVIHLAGTLTREKFHALSTALHAVGTLSIGAAIALVGQIFNLQEHWPSAILLWAIAALAGWALLRDQAQQTLALLLIPAWMVCEIAFYSQGHIGGSVYMGRMLFTWAIFYLTFFLGSKHKVVRGILFAVAAIAALVGIAAMLEGWVSFTSEQTFLPFSLRFWAWVAIAALPLIVAAFHGHKGLASISVGVAFAIVLPWCLHTVTETYTYPGVGVHSYTYTEPNLAAHALVAAFAAFLCWWGVRLASQALVNLGIVGFAFAVGWFYFSDIYSALGRSLGLIGLGILFLAGGWALEKMRRRIVAGIDSSRQSALNAAGEAQ
jgi:uncharacterized membrane protein